MQSCEIHVDGKGVYQALADYSIVEEEPVRAGTTI